MQERAQKAALEYLQMEALFKDDPLGVVQMSLKEAADKHGVANKTKVHYYVQKYREEGRAAHIPPPPTAPRLIATAARDSKTYSEGNS